MLASNWWCHRKLAHTLVKTFGFLDSSIWMRQSVCVSVRQSVCVSVRQRVCVSVRQSVYVSVWAAGLTLAAIMRVDGNVKRRWNLICRTARDTRVISVWEVELMELDCLFICMYLCIDVATTQSFTNTICSCGHANKAIELNWIELNKRTGLLY